MNARSAAAEITQLLEEAREHLERGRLKSPPPMAVVLDVIGREVADVAGLVASLPDVDPDDLEEKSEEIACELTSISARVSAVWTAADELDQWRVTTLLTLAGQDLDGAVKLLAALVLQLLYQDELPEAAE